MSVLFVLFVFVTDKTVRPKIIQVEPSSPATFNVDDVMTFHCVAEGNPVPKISWLQQNGRDKNVWNIRGRNATLTVVNASYSHQGVYRCEASNVVKNQPYRVQSPEVHIDIRGPPQIMVESSKTRDFVEASKEEDAVITVVFCADPKPVETFWGWGSYKLKTGSALGRFVAEPLLAVRMDEMQCPERLDFHITGTRIHGVPQVCTRAWSYVSVLFLFPSCVAYQ
ncbi:hypothetical protein HPB48_020123 [Haemaphysalis longicornis]|uniref:Ig-like domain-containing protein n=1 Tax=Haemaphysalis longicornis TaxID=44386 RepID=A0A9J6FYL5_HAELO|nr:hypothetical protein HPB48_020123 [Haemaphysalis longicornis]